MLAKSYTADRWQAIAEATETVGILLAVTMLTFAFWCQLLVSVCRN
jgi:hypothetical protein